MLGLKLKLGLSCVQQAGGGESEPVILEVIDEVGNTEITEYINNDVTEVTTYVRFEDCPALENVTIPALTTVGEGVTLICSALTVLSLSAMEEIGQSFIVDAPLAGNFDISELESVGWGINFFSATVTSIDLSSLTEVGIPDDSSGSITIACSQLTTLTFPVLLVIHNTGFAAVNLSGCALDQTSVDAILVRLAALDGTAGTTLFENSPIDLSGGTNAVPSATGLTAKATLEGRGNTVTVNS